MESTIDETLDHVTVLARRLNKCDVPCAVTVALLELGVPSKSLGYEFLKRAIIMLYKDPLRRLSNDVYAEIAVRCRTVNEETVEQDVRDVLKKAWRTGSRVAWNWYFSYDGQEITHRPSNSDFIFRIVRVLQIWKGFYGEEGSDEIEY